MRAAASGVVHLTTHPERVSAMICARFMAIAVLIMTACVLRAAPSVVALRTTAAGLASATIYAQLTVIAALTMVPYARGEAVEHLAAAVVAALWTSRSLVSAIRRAWGSGTAVRTTTASAWALRIHRPPHHSILRQCLLQRLLV